MGSVEADNHPSGEAMVQGREPSVLTAHSHTCCEVAASWLASMDASHCLRAAPPYWIVDRYEWGATRWPLYLCEAVRAERLDCGALAALSLMAWRRRCPSVFAVQLIQRYSEQDIDHWSATWQRAGVQCDWISGDLIYHEAVGIVKDGVLSVWDSTDGIFLSHEARGYGSIQGICAHAPGILRFGPHLLNPGQWTWG